MSSRGYPRARNCSIDGCTMLPKTSSISGSMRRTAWLAATACSQRRSSSAVSAESRAAGPSPVRNPGRVFSGPMLLSWKTRAWRVSGHASKARRSASASVSPTLWVPTMLECWPFVRPCSRSASYPKPKVRRIPALYISGPAWSTVVPRWPMPKHQVPKGESRNGRPAAVLGQQGEGGAALDGDRLVVEEAEGDLEPTELLPGQLQAQGVGGQRRQDEAPPRPGLAAVVVGGHRLHLGPPRQLGGVPQGRREDRRLRHEDVPHLGRGDPHLHRRRGQGEGDHAHGAAASQGAHAEARRIGIAHRHVELLGQLQVQVVPRLGDVLNVPRTQGRLHHEEAALRLSRRTGESQRPVGQDPLVARLVPPRHGDGAVVEDPVTVVQAQPEGDHRGLGGIGVGQAQQVHPRVVLPRDAHHRAPRDLRTRPAW